MIIEKGASIVYNGNMTAVEKKSIFDFLKTASSSFYGYSAPQFSQEPFFEDDFIETCENAEPENTESGKADSHENAAVYEGSAAENAGTLKDKASSLNSAGNTVNNETKGLNLAKIAEKVQQCRQCILCKTRKNAVPGEGYPVPYVLVVGEGPGEDEDNTGRPFVGKAGQLLDKMLEAINLDRNVNCYITNIVKCRPPMNRVPMPDEADSCLGFLQSQIHILKPKLILALGRTAAQNLLKTSQGINTLHGKFFECNGIPLLATYHPSALLRDPLLKRPAWEDLKTFREKLREMCPDYDENFTKK